MTVNSDVEFGVNGHAGGNGAGADKSDDFGDGAEDKFFQPPLATPSDRSLGFRFRRHAGPFLACLLSFLALLSPVVMVALPNLGLLRLRENRLICGLECDGMIVSLAFKLLVLLIGAWAVFLRRPRATLPRMRIFRALTTFLSVVFLVSFWLFYASHVAHERELVTYRSLVQFALNLTDSLLFVHYLALLLLELRQRQAQYFLKVTRSPDGESRVFPVGEVSVQRAAEFVLDKYYTEFPIYNPYLDKVSVGGGGSIRMRKGVKMYDVDGLGGNMNVSVDVLARSDVNSNPVYLL